jgi:hypothetical protein
MAMEPTRVRCGNPNCAVVLDELVELPATERTPCPQCGSVARLFEPAGGIQARAAVSAELSVERGLNGMRLAVLGILVTIGLTVGFGVQSVWWVRGLAGLSAFAVSSALIAWRRSRHLMMAYVHRISGS